MILLLWHEILSGSSVLRVSKVLLRRLTRLKSLIDRDPHLNRVVGRLFGGLGEILNSRWRHVLLLLHLVSEFELTGHLLVAARRAPLVLERSCRHLTLLAANSDVCISQSTIYWQV